jgi:putative transposase
MARKLRVQYPGAIYHLMNRGDHREAIFCDDLDRAEFLNCVTQTCTKTLWQVHGFCLMANHFHLIVETPQPNLVAGMKWFLGVYTSRFNRRHNLSGHLFSGRYKAVIIDGSGNGYLKTVGDYVHLNPVRANLLRPEQSLETYVWSSYPHYLQEPFRRPAWLRVDRLLGEWGIAKDSKAGRQQFATQMELRRRTEADADFKMLRRSWCFGSEEFRRELLAEVDKKQGKWHYGPEFYESAEAKAEALIQSELQQKGYTEAQLKMRRKGDPFKVMLAQKLRSETTVTMAWIANRLQMGTRGHLSHLLYWNGKEHNTPNAQQTLDL